MSDAYSEKQKVTLDSLKGLAIFVVRSPAWQIDNSFRFLDTGP